MDAWINSFLLVFAGEIGDKTQLLSLVLAARFGRPWVILAGVLVATLLNHALAAWAGNWVASLVAPQTLTWILAVTFFAFAAWVLIPDKEGELRESAAFGAFITTVISFFIAEMGDKTQLATIALGARYPNAWMVTVGTTAGMLAANAPAIFWGPKMLKKIPMKAVRITAAVLFLLFGVLILIKGL